MVGIDIVLDFLEKEIKELTELAAKFQFDASHPLHQHTISLYGTTLELSSALIPLYRSGHYSGIPILLRSILEAYVDLENLCHDPKYGYTLTISSIKESLKFLRAAKSDDNVYMDIIAKAPDLDERIATMQSEIDTLKESGYKDLNKLQRFQQADMEDEYRTIYNMLCSAAHNDFRTLRERHMVLDGDTFSMEYFKRPDMDSLESYFGVASELLLRASFALHSLLKSEKMEELQVLRSELDQIRASV